MKKLKSIPKFKNEQQESEFWSDHDSTQFIDWEQAKVATFSNLKPSTQSISLRLPESLLNEIKVIANKEDIPYQSLIKFLLAQGVHHLHKQDRK
jgi:predicted DNA binding CopG/RHH family protein